MELTKRQAIFLTLICLLASKVQRLPSLVSVSMGRHGFLVFLVMGGIDIVMLLVCLLFNKLAGRQTTYGVLKKTGGQWLAKTIYLGLAVYYFFNAILPYEAVHDLFGNILFDELSWGLYSLVLVFAVLFIASRGLKNLGRLSEIFFMLIVLSFATLLVFGASTTDFHRSLPLTDISGSALLGTCFQYNVWFGDFLVIYMFVGRMKEDDGKLGWPVILSFAVATIVLAFTYMVFYGLYDNLSGEQNSLISSISQFALLDLDIGRIDWFFVLFFQFSTLISASTYIFLSARALAEVVFDFKKLEKQNKEKTKRRVFIFLAALSGALYLLDIFVFKSNQEGVAIMADVTKYFGIVIVLVVPVILLVFGIIFNQKCKKQEKHLQNQFKTLNFVQKNAKHVKNSAKNAKKRVKNAGGVQI